MPSSSSSNAGRLPETAEVFRHQTEPSSVTDGLQEQGLQLMQAAYQTAAAGVNKLAASDVSLQNRLHKMPARIVLDHNVSNTLPQASMNIESEGQHSLIPDHWYTSVLSKQRHMRLSLSAGGVLLHRTPKELVFVAAQQLSHAIGRHSEERRSWTLLYSIMLLARLCFASFSIGTLLGSLVMYVGLVKPFVCFWFGQQTEYDADAMGAMITKAAGCNSASIVSSLQRFHMHSILQRRGLLSDLQAAATAALAEDTAALQRLLPGTQHFIPRLYTAASSSVHFWQLQTQSCKAPQRKSSMRLQRLSHVFSSLLGRSCSLTEIRLRRG